MDLDPVLWRRASACFDELIDLAPEARDRRLEQLRASEPELAREVERLLDADGGSGVLDHGIGAMAPTVAERLGAGVEADSVPEAAPGDVVGPFQLLRLVGRGGMGEVFLAERSDGGFVQQVALKVLKRGMDSEEIVHRFVRERSILARLSHPNIARFLDGGMSARNRPWYAMEYISGVTLTEYARQQALSVRQRIELLTLVCDAVAYAHTQLVVHRDLKPNNILVDASGQPRVLDFGIAKLLDENDDAYATATGTRVMSPAYAAPEQVLGESIGTPADVYSLGVLLFELLTGQLPHHRNARTPEAMARDVSQESASRPSQVLRSTHNTHLGSAYGAISISRERVARTLSGDLDTIILFAMQRDPSRRYVSAAALADDLRRWLNGRPISARPDTARYRMAKFVRRHRGGVLASLATLFALVGGLGMALWQSQVARQEAVRADGEARRATLEAQRAEVESEAAREMTARARRVKDFLISVFLQEDQLRRDDRGPLTMAEAFEDTLQRIDTELEGDPGLQADLLDDFGEIVTAKGDLEKAQILFERALAAAEKANGPDDPAVAESLTNLGVLAGYRGQLAEGKPYLIRAVAILEGRRDTDPIALATVMMALGTTYRNEGDMTKALPMLRRSLELIGGPDGTHPGRLAAMGNIAVTLLDIGEFDEAEQLTRKVIVDTEALQGPEATPLIVSLSTLEQILWRKGEMEEMREVGERRLAMARKSFPGDHPWKAVALVDSGWTLVLDEQYAEGESLIQEGIAIHQRLGGRETKLISALHRLALSQQRHGDARAAQLTFETAGNLCSQSGQAVNKICLTLRASRARLQAEMGEPAQALLDVNATLALIAEKFGTGVDEYAQALEARSTALKMLDRHEESLAAQRDAVAVYSAIYGTDHESTARAQRHLSLIEQL